MFWIGLLATVVAAYFTYDEYKQDRTGWAIFWAALLGWDIHALLGLL